MAKGKKTGGKDIEPGKSLNPVGRPPLPEWTKDLKKMNQETFQAALKDLCSRPMSEVRAIATKDEYPSKMIVMANLLDRATRDNYACSSLLDRLYGKPKEQVEVSIHGTISRMSDEDLLVACRDAIKIVEEERLIGSGTGTEE